jgi:hypothetical protein
MKISEMISELERYKEQYGDIDVREKTNSRGDTSCSTWDIDPDDLSYMKDKNNEGFINIWAY